MANQEVQILKKEFPANNYISKKQEVETDENGGRKKAEKVVTAGVVTRKPSPFKRFKEAFFGEDIGSVGDYILYDVLIPAIRDTLEDMVNNGLHMLLTGDSRGRRREGRSTYVSYNSYSRGRSIESRDRDRDRGYRSRRSNDIQDIICQDRGEAEQVLDELLDYVDRYGQATVADLYDLVGITTSITDNNWGWENLNTARVDRVSGGYLLNLPKPISLR